MSYAEHRRHGRQATPRVRVAILTSSDSRTESTDDSGDLIERLVARQRHHVVARGIAADEVVGLRKAADRLLREEPDVLIVNGGTGISPRDVAVEAFEPWFEKRLPGFGERFRALSEEQVATGAWLSRSAAATIRRRRRAVLLFLLPGSPDACKLAVERLILPELAHAVTLLRGAKPHA